MIGDKIIISKLDKQRAKFLVEHYITHLRPKSIIVIGGSSGSKKSELGQCIQEELYKKNIKSLLVSLDDYYVSHFNERTRIRELKGVKYVGTKEIDWQLVKKIIKDFKNKKNKLILQQINKYTGDYDNIHSFGIKEVKYLILEGMYANYLKKIKLADLGIHLEGTPEQTLKFRKKRKKENENSKFRQKIVKKEYIEVNKLKKYADIIIPFGEIK